MMKNYVGALLGVLTVLCWSGYNVAAKHGIEAGLTPHALTFLRFAVPGLIMLPALAVLWVRGQNLRLPIWQLLTLILLGGPVFGLIAVSGYVHAPLSHGLLFAPVAVFLSGSLLGYFLLQEHLRAGRITGAVIMFAGLTTLVNGGFGEGDAASLKGAAMFCAAGAIWSVLNAASGREGKHRLSKQPRANREAYDLH